MSEKKYLLSEQDLKCLFHSAWDCMISESNVVEFVKAHEHREPTQHTHCCPCGAERTCHPVIEDETEVCSECGEDIGGYGWTYCPNCGAAISL